ALAIALATAATAATACGGGGDSSPDALFSTCGHPGDVGNSLGVGKFCAMFSDCNDTVDAPLCSSLGDATTHFCTKTCDTAAPDCGEDAMCVCNGGGQ